MNIYLLSQEVNNNYDTFDAVVVAAASEEKARLITPYKNHRWQTEDEIRFFGPKHGLWANTPDKVKVRFLGVANEDIEEGVILSSFNAG